MGQSKPHILVVDDDHGQLRLLAEELPRRGYRVTVAESAAVDEPLLQAYFDAAVLEVCLESGEGGVICERLSSGPSQIPVVAMSTGHDAAVILAAMRAGACDYLAKPVDLSELHVCLGRLTHRRRIQQQLQLSPRPSALQFGGMLGQSAPMRRLFDLMERVAASDVSVLITGETGTGKELVANAIHQASPRGDGPFVAVNCAAMPENLLESELFGHARGAFTDAKGAYPGLLVHAKAGSVFLDEIGDMPAGLQPKLLRALQERIVRPVGSTREIPLDVRLLSATHRDLEREVRRGAFRHDLYFRLNVVQLNVPPLRERGNDILLLAQHLMERCAKTTGKPVYGISLPAAERLMAYGWPGNVRELSNCIERAVALTRHEEIAAEDLPSRVRSQRGGSGVYALPEADGSLPSMADVERRHLLRVLRAVGGNKTAAARVLGFNRKTLYRKLQRYGLHLEDESWS